MRLEDREKILRFGAYRRGSTEFVLPDGLYEGNIFFGDQKSANDCGLQIEPRLVRGQYVDGALRLDFQNKAGHAQGLLIRDPEVSDNYYRGALEFIEAQGKPSLMTAWISSMKFEGECFLFGECESTENRFTWLIDSFRPTEG